MSEAESVEFSSYLWIGVFPFRGRQARDMRSSTHGGLSVALSVVFWFVSDINMSTIVVSDGVSVNVICGVGVGAVAQSQLSSEV